MLQRTYIISGLFVNTNPICTFTETYWCITCCLRTVPWVSMLHVIIHPLLVVIAPCANIIYIDLSWDYIYLINSILEYQRDLLYPGCICKLTFYQCMVLHIDENILPIIKDAASVTFIVLTSTLIVLTPQVSHDTPHIYPWYKHFADM